MNTQVIWKIMNVFAVFKNQFRYIIMRFIAFKLYFSQTPPLTLSLALRWKSMAAGVCKSRPTYFHHPSTNAWISARAMAC